MNTINDAQVLEQKIAEGAPVLVSFKAPWCGPCKMLEPRLESLSQKLAGQVSFVAVDIEEDRASAARYRVRGVPTMVLFHQGQPVQTRVGATSEATILEWLRAGLGAGEGRGRSA